MEEVKFLIKLPEDLRESIKREARKNGITMNEFIKTVLEQFIAIQRGNDNGNVKGTSN